MTYTEITDTLKELTETNDIGSYTAAIQCRNINLAMDDYQSFVKKVSGTWQVDDSNHVKYPNMTFHLVSGQQDYNFTVDEQGNQIQDIYRVECKDSNGVWQLLTPYNEMDEETALSAQELLSGVPTRYYKTANGIFLDKTPSYSSTSGIRMWYTRPPSYFLVTDTTKEPGIPNAHHRYLALKPAYWYWLPKDSTRASLYKAELREIEDDIKADIAQRTRDERPRMTTRQESNR